MSLTDWLGAGAKDTACVRDGVLHKLEFVSVALNFVAAHHHGTLRKNRCLSLSPAVVWLPTVTGHCWGWDRLISSPHFLLWPGTSTAFPLLSVPLVRASDTQVLDWPALCGVHLFWWQWADTDNISSSRQSCVVVQLPLMELMGRKVPQNWM